MLSDVDLADMQLAACPRWIDQFGLVPTSRSHQITKDPGKEIKFSVSIARENVERKKWVACMFEDINGVFRSVCLRTWHPPNMLLGVFPLDFT